MFTVDASVWINAYFADEPGHAVSRAFLETLTRRSASLYLPHLAAVEIVAGIARALGEGSAATEYLQSIARLRNVTWVAVDDATAHRAASLAAQHRLRGADAIYTAVAQQYRCTLVSLDQDHLNRAPLDVPALSPADAVLSIK